MQKVSIVIISFNTRDILRDCLFALDGIYPQMEVFVVDNASEDGSASMVAQEFPWVKLTSLNENLGFSKANNLAIKQSSGDFVLFLGSDALIRPGVIEEMLSLFESDDRIGMATCKVELRSGDLDADCHRGFPTPWVAFCYFSGLEQVFTHSKLFGGYHQTWKNLNTTHEIDACIGHFMFVRQTALEEVGYWDEDFFFYGEDLDFCYRFKKAGWKIVYHPQVSITHYKGASSGIRKESADVTTASSATKLRILQSSVEAMEMFYKKHYRSKYPRWLTGVVIMGIKLLGRLRVLKGER